jgi:replicative DNA helicase
MKNSRYIEIGDLVQVIGCVYKNPKLFEHDDKYRFNEEDFYDDFHKVVFGCIYNLWQLGAKEISLPAVEDYLTQRPKALATFKTNKGQEFLLKAAEIANLSTFDYYYNRMKKMSLLRAYEDMGMQLDWLYDPNEIFNVKRKQEQEDWLDNATLEDISNKINDKIDCIKEKYIHDIQNNGSQIGDGIDALIESFKETPSFGYPMYGDYINTVTRGARLGKFYLRSAATGTGKTRSKIADCCFIGCEQMFDIENNKWISIGVSQPCLFIATEQDLQECQSMCLAFISGVNEEHILQGEYFPEEEERVRKASQILKNSKIYFECMPDFTMASIETTIKRHIRENKVQYIFMDYLHSSASILMEVGGSKGVKGLREDNVLFLLSSKLKDIAVQYGVFILSSTQLNSSYLDSETPNQNLLRGSKAIADRIDIGMIMLDVTKDDREKLQQFCKQNGFPIPTVKISVYKNRQGRWESLYLWANADKGTCRINPMFATDWGFNILEMKNLKIKVEEPSLF